MNPTLLIAWFDAHARQLPWREPGTTPWGVLVSEVMLQQTPVHRVAAVWSEWLVRWPTPSSLAAETPGAAVRAWASWATRGARYGCMRLPPSSPRSTTTSSPQMWRSLLALPGIGAYTARAVAAFGYGHRVPVVDTNVRRVVARAMHGSAEAGPPSTSRDLSDVDGDPARAVSSFAGGPLLRRADGARCGGVHGRPAALRRAVRWPVSAPGCAPVGRPRPSPADPRSLRGHRSSGARVAADVLRAAVRPGAPARLDAVWRDAAQRDRCLASLLIDGLIEPTLDGRYALPGEHAAAPEREP